VTKAQIAKILDGMMEVRVLYTSALRYIQFMDSCRHGDEHLGSMKGVPFRGVS
jgi:hypothetical protein